MNIKVQTWSPDTCKCSFEEWVDYDEPLAIRDTNFSSVLKACDPHLGIYTVKGHNHAFTKPCMGPYFWRWTNPAKRIGKVVNGSSCYIGQTGYNVVKDENRLKNHLQGHAALLVPWEHVFNEALNDGEIIDKIAKRVIAQEPNIAAIDLLQKIEYLVTKINSNEGVVKMLSKVQNLPNRAEKLKQSMMLAAYGWRFDEKRILHVDFEIPLRPEHRKAIEVKIEELHGPNRFVWESGIKDHITPPMLELMARR